MPGAPAGRFDGIERPYSAAEVSRLRGSLPIRHSLAEHAADRLWRLLARGGLRQRLGALSGNQAMQMVRAGLKAIYLSGWQVAADANTAGAMYPDQSLYPANSGPELVRRINRTLQRADQIETLEGRRSVETWFAPIVADAEAGFGGPLNAFEIMKAFIEAGAAGVHFEDQLASEKKCGHMGGKVLIPTAAHIRNLVAARLAADVMGVPTLVIARTDAEAAKLITSDVDERDRALRHRRRAHGGRLLPPAQRAGALHRPRHRLRALRRPHLVRDLEAGPRPGAALRRRRAQGASGQDARLQLLAVASTGRSTSTTRPSQSSSASCGAMGYKFQFITLAGFHQLNFGMFELARGYRERQMAAYSELQEAEFAAEARRLHRDAPPARGRHRLFRRRVADHHRRPRPPRPPWPNSTEAAQFSRRPPRSRRRPAAARAAQVQEGERRWIRARWNVRASRRR